MWLMKNIMKMIMIQANSKIAEKLKYARESMIQATFRVIY